MNKMWLSVILPVAALTISCATTEVAFHPDSLKQEDKAKLASVEYVNSTLGASEVRSDQVGKVHNGFIIEKIDGQDYRQYDSFTFYGITHALVLSPGKHTLSGIAKDLSNGEGTFIIESWPFSISYNFEPGKKYRLELAADTLYTFLDGRKNALAYGDSMNGRSKKFLVVQDNDRVLLLEYAGKSGSSVVP